MVPILVFLTFGGFIVGGLILAAQRRREEVAEVSERPGDNLFFHPGHTWARRDQGGLIEVGASELAANFIGGLDRIEMPALGTNLRQGEPVWTMVANNGRRLTQVMPVAGRVVEVNERLDNQPDEVQKDSYHSGWMLRVRPSPFGSGLRDLLHGGEVEQWLDTARSRVVSSLCTSVGAVAHDGGMWVQAYGDLLDGEHWAGLKTELFESTGSQR